MRNNSSSQVSSNSYRRFLPMNIVAGINNEVILLLLIMIILFFVNLYSLIKNNVINTIYNILKRTFQRLMNSNIAFIKNIDVNVSRLDKDSKGFEKGKESKFNDEQMCYICLNSINLEVMAGCFHSFCGKCIIKYWRSQNNFQIKCPVCRRDIKMLYFNEARSCLKQEVVNTEENNKWGQTIKALYEYNYHFSKEQRTWKEILLDFPFLIKRTMVFIISREGIQFFLRTLESNFYLMILIIYVLSPFDIIPECIFGFIGLIDDLMILILIFIILTNYYYQYISARDSKRYTTFLDY